MLRIAVLLALLTPVFASAQSIDLLWQGETYTPPFYEGRSLWSSESRVTFTAIPHIAGRSPANIYFRWTKDGTVLGSMSGFNRHSLTLMDTVLSLPMKVKVDARDNEDGEVFASATVELRPQTSRLLIYEDNPLYGVMTHKAIGQVFELSDEEATLTAIPLFASVSFRSAPVLSYAWTTNTGDVRTGNRVTYRAPEGEEGSSSVTLRMENARILAQPPAKNFLIEFGQNDAQF